MLLEHFGGSKLVTSAKGPKMRRRSTHSEGRDTTCREERSFEPDGPVGDGITPRHDKGGTGTRLRD